MTCSTIAWKERNPVAHFARQMPPAESTATIDSDFAKEVEAAIAAHREPLEPPAWD
jgi:hypothetical protein